MPEFAVSPQPVSGGWGFVYAGNEADAVFDYCRERELPLLADDTYVVQKIVRKGGAYTATVFEVDGIPAVRALPA